MSALPFQYAFFHKKPKALHTTLFSRFNFNGNNGRGYAKRNRYQGIYGGISLKILYFHISLPKNSLIFEKIQGKKGVAFM
jgi:hypothetical protein